MRASSTLSTLIASFTAASLPTGPNGDVETIDSDYQEKALRVLVNIAAAWGFDAEERKQVLEVATTMESDGLDLEQCGLVDEEWKSFKASLLSSTRPPAQQSVLAPPTDIYGLIAGAPDGARTRPTPNPNSGSYVVNSAGAMQVDHDPEPLDMSLSFLSTGTPVLARSSAPNAAPYDPAVNARVRLARSTLDSSMLVTSSGGVLLETASDDREEDARGV